MVLQAPSPATAGSLEEEDGEGLPEDVIDDHVGEGVHEAEEDEEDEADVEDQLQLKEALVLLLGLVLADSDEVEDVLSIDQHAPMNQSQRQVIQEHEQVPVEEAHEGQECVYVDLIRDPFGHLVGEVEGLDESLIHVIMRQVKVQRARRASDGCHEIQQP